MSPQSFGWLLVLLAGSLEVLWPILMKQSQLAHGWMRIAWLGLMMATMCASFGLLAWAVGQRFRLPIGTAYAVWTGMGATGAAVVGILLFQETRDAARLFFLALVVIGIVGLRFTHRAPAPENGATGGLSASACAPGIAPAPGEHDMQQSASR